jgi:UDP:flavonoid glycosyltransferase YjiC (YdhE family)
VDACTGAAPGPASRRCAAGSAPELRAWLDQGEPPVFFGFGSMPVLDPSSAAEMITGVARRLGVRALIGAAGRGLAVGVRDATTFITERVDHDLVLPRCRAAVRNGGAGTTHTVLRAGLPAMAAEQPAEAIMELIEAGRVPCAIRQTRTRAAFYRAFRSRNSWRIRI